MVARFSHDMATIFTAKKEPWFCLETAGNQEWSRPLVNYPAVPAPARSSWGLAHGHIIGFLLFPLLLLFFKFVCVHHLCEGGFGGQKRDPWGAGVRPLWAACCGFWEPNTGLLEQ